MKNIFKAKYSELFKTMKKKPKKHKLSTWVDVEFRRMCRGF